MDVQIREEEAHPHRHPLMRRVTAGVSYRDMG
jgi:hypothetical protein